MNSYLDQLSALPAVLVYLVVCVLVFGESAALLGIVLPGELALLAGGTVAALGHASVWVLIVVAAISAVAGDSVGFLIGRRSGSALRSGRIGTWIGERRWSRAENAMVRHGGTVVVVARWVGGLRSLVPVLAGMTGMQSRRYLILNAVGGAAWVVGVSILGYLAGTSLSSSTLTTMTVTIAGCLVVAATAHVGVRKFRQFDARAELFS